MSKFKPLIYIYILHLFARLALLTLLTILTRAKSYFRYSTDTTFHFKPSIGPLYDPVTWYGINYTGTQITQWDFQNKGKLGWTCTSSFVLEVPLRNLRSSVLYSVPCDRIVQRAYNTIAIILSTIKLFLFKNAPPSTFAFDSHLAWCPWCN